jgi:hypothetical protein
MVKRLRTYAPTIAAVAVFVALYFATRPAPPPRPPPVPHGIEVAVDGAGDVPGKTIDLELHAASVQNVFRLLGEMSGKSIHLDECVRGTLDLRLSKAPLRLAFDAIAAKMALTYEERDGATFVHCGDRLAATSDDRLAARVTVDARDAGVDDVVAHVATAAKLDGVDWRANAHPNVTITMTNVRASTAIEALAETSGLRMHAARGKIVVEDR